MHNYSDYLSYTRKIYDVYMSMSVLNWDMETHMPKNGNRFRSQQLSTLQKLHMKCQLIQNMVIY